MDGRRKTAFWLLVMGALALSAVPSIVLMRTLENYYRFLTGFAPETLRPTHVKFIPHRSGRAGKGDESFLQFVEFQLRAPAAKRVSLMGDFTHWKTDALTLAKQPDGSWEILIPLLPGRYRYLYLVDGVPKLDPGNQEAEEDGERKASVRTVGLN